MQVVRIEREEELHRRLRQGNARILCGGTDLLIKIRSGLMSASCLLDISDVATLRGVTSDAKTVTIGAATPLSEIMSDPTVRADLPLLVEALKVHASVQIRNRGSLGGNLVNASPAADGAIPLLLYDAHVEVVGSDGPRWSSLGAFFLGPGKTILQADEYVRSIRMNRPREELRAFFHKVGKRRALTIAIASIGVLGRATGEGIAEFRAAAGSVAPVPMRLDRVEERVRGERITPSLIDEARRIAMVSVSPIDDVRASAEYRRAVVGDLVARALSHLG